MAAYYALVFNIVLYTAVAYLEHRGADMLVYQLKGRLRQRSDTQVRVTLILRKGKHGKSTTVNI